MKKAAVVIFIICLMLCSCTLQGEEGTTAQETAGAENTSVSVNTSVAEPTSADEEKTTLTENITGEKAPLSDAEFRNPLNGRELDSPFDGRAFAVSLNTDSEALPMRGVSDADIFIEALSDGYGTKGLAVFSDIASVKCVGPVSSARYVFTDFSLAYDFILCHSGASAGIMSDMNVRGAEHLGADDSYGYRDVKRELDGFDWEYTLFARGSDIADFAEASGCRLKGSEYAAFHFSDNGAPENGEKAREIEISFTLDSNTKKTLMIYDESEKKYIFNQYGNAVTDENNGEAAGFTNVLVLYVTAYTDGAYHISELFGEGTGYYACGGKMIPLRWSHENENEPVALTKEDGSPVVLGAGNSYIALCPAKSEINVK